MSVETIHLFTTIDPVWLPYACVMIKSVRLHSTENICYWIVHDDIPNDHQRLVRNWGLGEGVDLRFVHFPSLQSTEKSGFLRSIRSFSTTSPGVSFGRFVPDFFLRPAGVTRAIYADVDMLAVGSIAPLMTVALDGMTVGAVRSDVPVPAAGNAGLSEAEYFNNGLLVFDVDRFDGVSCLAKMNAALATGHLTFGPQCAFSSAMRGAVCPLEDKWNVQMASRAIVGAQARLIHFTGNLKPWHCLSVDPLRHEIRRILETTPFASSWEPDRTLRKRARGVARRWKRAVQALRP